MRKNVIHFAWGNFPPGFFYFYRYKKWKMREKVEIANKKGSI